MSTFAAVKSILSSAASLFMRATYGSASVASLTRIFWMSRSRRRRTVGYETPYSEAISLSDPDARTNRLMNETSSSSRSAIQGGGKRP